MKLGGLSEDEIKTIISILEAEGIEYVVKTDSDIASFNQNSIKNNLRHLTPPNISTHILSIHINDDDFEKITEVGKKKLFDYGITDIGPNIEDFKSFSGETIHQELLESPKRLVGVGFIHQIIYAFIALSIGLMIKYCFDHFL